MPRAFIATLFFAGFLSAAEPTPREQVLRLVPPDSAVCFVVQNLRDQAKAVGKSPFAAWAQEKLAPGLGANADAKKLKDVEALIEQFIGVKLTELRDEVFGDCMAFAYERGHRPEDERGVAILYAKDPAKLRTLIDKLNNWQKDAGELQSLKTHTHAGRTYFQRDRGDKGTEFYFIQEHIFAFAAKEDSIKAILDRMERPTESPVLKALDELKLQNAFLACWLNPRKLDLDLLPPTTATAAEKAGRAQMAKLWSAVDQCALFLTAGEDIECGLSVTYRAEAMPPELKAAFARTPAKPPLWDSIPADAILAAVGDVEANALLDMVSSFLPEADRPLLRQKIEKELAAIVGKDKLPAFFAGLGSDFGIWAEKSSKPGEPLPVITAVIRLQQGAGVPAVLQVIQFYAKLLQYDYNRDHSDQIKMEDGEKNGLTWTTFTNDKLFPPGVEPTYATVHGFLVLASNPIAITAFKAPAGAKTAAGDVPLVRINAVALRDHITKHRDGLAKLLAELQERTEADIARDLDQVASVLEALERVDLVVRGDSKSRTFAVRAKLVKPLK